MAQWAEVADNYFEAVEVVLGGLGKELDPAKCLWCNYPAFSVDANRLRCNVNRDASRFVDGYDFDISRCVGWLVGIPEVKLTRRGIPCLSFEIGLHYVASDGRHAIWGTAMPKADRFECPLALIAPLVKAIKQGRLETAAASVVERGSGCTIYDFKGREWRIPDAFLGFILALAEKGKGFEGLLDAYSCELMNRFAKELPTADVPKLPSGDDYELIVSGLKQMGFPKAQAEQAARIVTDKFPSSTLEEKVRQALKYLGG